MPVTDTSFTVSDQPVEPGYNWGGSGFPVSTGWTGTNAWSTFLYTHSQGMTNIFNTDIAKHSCGDLNILSLNVQTRGGQVDCSAEGVSMVRPYLQVGTPPYEATIATGGPKATFLVMAWANNNIIGVGQTLLDLSAITSCNVVSASPTWTPDGRSYQVMKTDGNFTPSQQITLNATSNAVNDPQNNAGSVQTLNFHVGGQPLQVGALIKLGGTFPEAIRVITAAPVDANGNQDITALVRAQHWGGTIGMTGGPAGMYLEQTKFTKNGVRFVSHVLGAVDAQTLWVFNAVPGGADMGYLFDGPMKLYWGATITDVRDAGDPNNCSGYNVHLEENGGAWPVAGNVEQPNHATAWWQTYVSFIQNYNPFSSGAHFRIGGVGSAFGSVGDTRLFDIRNSEPDTSYNFKGGFYNPMTAFTFSGVIGGIFNFDAQPRGPLFLSPVDSFVTLFACTNHTAYLSYDTYNGGNGQWNVVADQINLTGRVLVNGLPVGVAEVSPAGITGTVQAGEMMTFKNGLLVKVG